MTEMTEVTVWWVVLIVGWLATVSSISGAEIAIAALLAVPCALAARWGRRAGDDRWRLRSRWAGWLGRLPAAVVREAVGVVKLAASSSPARGQFRELRLPVEPDAAAQATRAGLSMLVISSAPGSLAVDSGGDRRTILVHVLPVGDDRLTRAVTR